MKSVHYLIVILIFASSVFSQPSNTWILTTEDNNGAAFASFVYVPDLNGFIQWGPVGSTVSAYEVQLYNAANKTWTSQWPKSDWPSKWTSGSIARTYYNGYGVHTPIAFQTIEGLLKPVTTTIIWDGMAYVASQKKIYLAYPRDDLMWGFSVNKGFPKVFTYDVVNRRWQLPNITGDSVHGLQPTANMYGSLVYDPINDEVVLFGGGGQPAQIQEGNQIFWTGNPGGTWVLKSGSTAWRRVTGSSNSPPPRFFGDMVYDSKNKKIVLLGGFSGAKYLADTWLYDPASRTWEQKHPATHPAPNFHGYVMSFDSKNGVVLMIPWKPYQNKYLTWIYDVAKNEWKQLNVPVGYGEFFRLVSLAYDPVNDVHVALVQSEPGSDSQAVTRRKTYHFRLNLSTAVFNTTPPLPESRYFDSQWKASISQPAPDIAAIAAQANFLKNLPMNQPVKIKTPWSPRDRSWSSFVYDPEGQRIFWFGGGHGGYQGNDLVYYDIAKNRWYQQAAPEFSPSSWIMSLSNMGITLSGQWPAGHIYKDWEYDKTFHKLIFHPNSLNNESSKSLDLNVLALDNGIAGGYLLKVGSHGTALIPTHTWQGPSTRVYLLNPVTKKWNEILGSAANFRTGEGGAFVYDKQRDVIWCNHGNAGEIWKYSFATNTWTKINAPASGYSEHAWNAIFISKYDAFVMPIGGKLKIYHPSNNSYEELPVPVAANAPIAYDEKNDVIFMAGPIGDGSGTAADHFYAFKYVRTLVSKVSETGEAGPPDDFELDQNYPNPFNPETNISYNLPKAASITLKIYDGLGAEINTLVNEFQEAGKYVYKWGGKTSLGAALPSGVYVYKLQVGKGVAFTRKMLLIR